jgi:hypothetical protein
MPWQVRKSYESGGGGGRPRPWRGARSRGAGKGFVAVRTGDYDPLLGMTWSQVGSLARMPRTCARGWGSSRRGPARARPATCS